VELCRGIVPRIVPPNGSAFSGLRRSAEQALDTSDSRDPTTTDNG